MTLPTAVERYAFLAERQSGLGGSDIATLAGHGWGTPLELYYDKTRPIEEGEELNIHLLRGILLEPVIAQLYAEKTGRAIEERPMARHPDYEFATVNIDREVRHVKPGTDDPGVLEIKAPGVRSFETMIRRGVYDNYICQLMWGMFVTDASWGAFAAGNLESYSGPLVEHDMARNDSIIESLRQRAETFWNDHVLAGVPPEPTRPEPILMPDVSKEIVLVDDPDSKYVIQKAVEYRELRDRGASLYEDWRPHLDSLFDARGASKLRAPGLGRVYRLWKKGRRTLQRDILEASVPLDYDKVKALLVELSEIAITDEWMADLALDLTTFEKVGDDYPEIRIYAEEPEDV